MRHLDKLALVTGGASGLGWATATELCNSGARVIALDVTGPKSKPPPGYEIQLVDLTDTERLTTVFDTIVEEVGCPDYLICAAGISVMHSLSSQDRSQTFATMARILDINLLAVLGMVSLFSAAVAKQPEKDRSIVLVASGAAFDGVAGAVAYCASKGGIASATHAMARELACLKLRVNAIAPGPFDTSMLVDLPREFKDKLIESIPYPARPGAPKEFASLVLSIIENSYINGSVMRLDGAYRTAYP